MKPTARLAYVFIFLFFIFFNGLQVYLIIERISETKTKFGFACSDAMVSSLLEYSKLKSIDSASMPRHAYITYSSKKIAVTRVDSQSVKLSAPLSALVTDSVDPGIAVPIINSPSFKSIDLNFIGNLFQKALLLKNVHTKFRLDTIAVQDRKAPRIPLQVIWEKKRSKDYSYATRPVRIPQYSSFSVFAQLKYDKDFFRDDLLWPLVAFAFILLIGNIALVFVFNTIRKQKRINELKTDFINNMTHEMKTPITIAKAGVEALEHHVTPAERTRFYLDTTKRQLNLLNDFVERILDAAVQDVSDYSLKKEKINLQALFSELIQSHSIINQKPVTFQLNADGPVYIHGDRLHLETAFHNIIDNAIKYSNGSVHIIIDIDDNSNDCTIKIRDNGMGIQQQYIKNIFEKFFRVPQGDAQTIKGFGLGLYYVSSIIKKHMGNITVQSKPQSGTEFIITLPK